MCLNLIPSFSSFLSRLPPGRQYRGLSWGNRSRPGSNPGGPTKTLIAVRLTCTGKSNVRLRRRPTSGNYKHLSGLLSPRRFANFMIILNEVVRW
nr:MAG TPA: hypothetical protein [Caudoviricetes sp.]